MEPKRYSPYAIRSVGMTTITAHSACEKTPPNSVEHIRAAIASGAEFLEVDIRSNGEIFVLSHDEPEDYKACVRLETMFEMIAPYPSLCVNCDVKTKGLLEGVMTMARRYGVAHRVLFTGACNGRGEEIEALGGELWHSLWRSDDNEGDIRRAVEFCKQTSCPYINLDKRMVTEENLDYVQASGLNYSVWTPGDEEMLRFLLKKRVANITTREPLLALRLRDEIQGTPEENGLLPDGNIEKIIRDGAKIMLEADGHRLSVKQKSGTANFVTEYDVKVQHYLENEFSKLIPDCSFLAEEEDDSKNKIGEGYTFVIDPIDGTTNFMMGRRASCISVALLKNHKTVFGAIFDPYANRYYSAAIGKGAYCNRRPIQVSDREPSVGLASVGTSPYNRDTMARPVTEIVYGLMMNFGDIRRVGSAALEICAVACGELESYTEPILMPWDFSAGALILTEAGGIIRNFNGEEITSDGATSVMATTPTVYNTILGIVKGKI